MPCKVKTPNTSASQMRPFQTDAEHRFVWSTRLCCHAGMRPDKALLKSVLEEVVESVLDSDEVLDEEDDELELVLAVVLGHDRFESKTICLALSVDSSVMADITPYVPKLDGRPVLLVDDDITTTLHYCPLKNL